MGDWGLKISKTGSDVGTATDSTLSVTSKYTIPKVSSFGGSSVAVSGGNGTTTIAHGLGTTPLSLVYMENVAGNNRRYLLRYQVLANDPFGYSVDNTNLKVFNIGSQSAGTYNFFYYVFIDTI